VVTTHGAFAITSQGASVNGTVNPNGSTTDGFFEYGPTTAYGSRTALASLGAGAQDVQLSGVAIQGLACGTLYHYRAAATNAAGTATGYDNYFTTAACAAAVPPTVTTGTAANVSASGATLTASADGKGTSTNVSFQYGLTTQYGTNSTGMALTGAGGVSIDVAGLSCGTLYHFRAVATSANGTATGTDGTFTTSACPATAPVITIQPKDVTVKSGQKATLSVQATGSGTLTYQWYVGATGSTAIPVQGATNATYVTPVQNSAMSYWVRVANAAGSVDSRTASVYVKGRIR
jgi:hypothetical protein